MRMTFFILLMILPLSAVADKKWKSYEGPEKPKEALATYNLWNYPGFFSNLQIFTISFDQINFEEKGGLGNVSAVGGQVMQTPGKHVVRVSFVDSKNILFPAYMDSKTFPGWYEIEFIAEAGKIYAPIFDMNLAKENITDRMCIGSASAKKGLRAALAEIRKSKVYVACGLPTLDPKIDRSSWCKSWDGSASRTLTCKH